MSAFAGLEQGSLLSSFDPLSGEYLADPYPLLTRQRQRQRLHFIAKQLITGL